MHRTVKASGDRTIEKYFFVSDTGDFPMDHRLQNILSTRYVKDADASAESEI